MRSNPSRTRRRQGQFPDWVIWVLAAAFGLAALLAGILIFTSVRNVFSTWDGSGLPPLFQMPGTNTTPAPPGSTSTPVSVEVTAQPWNGTDRVTVLVMGLDYRDWETGEGAPRSDTMMLVSADPVNRTAGILSIPRDLWVEIPGFEHNRINTAYSLGESFDYPADDRHPGRGPGLAMHTVENLLGIPIQYYAVIEFSAFERMIDEIGGINILVTEPLRIALPGQQSFELEARPQHLDGAMALAYARARSSEGGDFDRSRRQQQVILAIRDQILNLDMVPTLLARAPILYQEFSAGVHTNLSLDQMISLGMLAMQIPQDSIRRGVIGPPDMVMLETLPDGAQVLKPVPDQIRLLRDEIFTLAGAIGPSIPVDNPATASSQENARVAVLNGAGIEGLASQTAEYLRGQGINVVEVANSTPDYPKTVVIDYTGNPYTTRYLMTLLNLSQSQILSQTVPDSEVDIAVIVGADYYLP